VVVGEVEAHRRERCDLRGGPHRIRIPVHPVQLVARQLDHEHVEATRIPDRIQHRHPDVAGRGGAEAAAHQHRCRQLGRRGLAVGPRDADPLGRHAVRAQHLVTKPPRELDVAPDRDAALRRPQEERMVGVIPGRHDDQLGVECDQLGGRTLIPRTLDEGGPDDADELAMLVRGLARNHQHLGAQLDEGVGRSETRHSQSEHDDAEPAPVGVPAGQRRQVS
jgi:hypothetical protein